MSENGSQVTPFSCAAVMPATGVRCVRQRWHGGDHRGADGETLYSWPDEPGPGYLVAAPDTATPPEPTILSGVPAFDEATLEERHERPPPWSGCLMAAVLALVLLVLLLALASVPAYLRAIY